MTLDNALTWLVGVSSLAIGLGHLSAPDAVADLVGWPRGSPFQWQAGMASAAIGIVGLMSSGFGRQFQLCVVVAFCVYYLGSAGGHIRQMVASGDFELANAGFLFVYDIVVSAAIIALYAAH